MNIFSQVPTQFAIWTLTEFSLPCKFRRNAIFLVLIQVLDIIPTITFYESGAIAISRRLVRFRQNSSESF